MTPNDHIPTSRYCIADDRISPTPDIMTVDEFREYCRDMNELNGWDIDLAISSDDAGIYLGRDRVADPE